MGQIIFRNNVSEYVVEPKQNEFKNSTDKPITLVHEKVDTVIKAGETSPRIGKFIRSISYGAKKYYPENNDFTIIPGRALVEITYKEGDPLLRNDEIILTFN